MLAMFLMFFQNGDGFLFILFKTILSDDLFTMQQGENVVDTVSLFFLKQIQANLIFNRRIFNTNS